MYLGATYLTQEAAEKFYILYALIQAVATTENGAFAYSYLAQFHEVCYVASIYVVLHSVIQHTILGIVRSAE